MIKTIYYRALSVVTCPIDRGAFDVQKVWANISLLETFMLFCFK